MHATRLIDEQLTHSVIGAFYKVYNALGYGFLESVYASALERELRVRGHRVGREVHVPVFYQGEQIARQRVDMMVEERLVIECKSTLDLKKLAVRQVYNYLRATDLQLGLLLHFGPEPQFFRVYRKSDVAVTRQRGHQEHRANPDDSNAANASD